MGGSAVALERVLNLHRVSYASLPARDIADSDRTRAPLISSEIFSARLEERYGGFLQSNR